MPNELAIPYLEKEAIIAVIEHESRFNASRAMSRSFPRMSHGAEKIEVRVRSRISNSVKHTTMDGEGVPIASGDMLIREYLPAWLKVFRPLSSREMAFFARAGEAAQRAEGGQMGVDFQARANDLIREIGSDLEADLGTERERLCSLAVQTGVITATLADGSTQSVDYGLHAITAPSTKWDNSGAKIVEDFYKAIEEFKENNPRGEKPNIAYYHPKLYAESFAKNTDWRDFKKANPDLAAGFLRLTQGARNEADVEGYFTDPVFGLTWKPIDGTYRNSAGSVVPFWDYKNITLAREDRMGAEWGMTTGHAYNPTAAVNVDLESPQRADVKTWKVHAYDNGLPVLKEPRFVQTWRVIT